MLYLLTGDIQIGKTTWLMGLVKEAKTHDIEPDGIICPAIFETSENKTGMNIMFLPDETPLPFSKRKDLLTGDEDIYPESIDILWKFYNDMMSAANDHLSKITPDHPSKHLLIIDELGMLEFRCNEGFTEALRILDEGCYENCILVVRPTLVEVATKRWQDAAGGPSCVQVIAPGFDYPFESIRDGR